MHRPSRRTRSLARQTTRCIASGEISRETKRRNAPRGMRSACMLSALHPTAYVVLLVTLLCNSFQCPGKSKCVSGAGKGPQAGPQPRRAARPVVSTRLRLPSLPSIPRPSLPSPLQARSGAHVLGHASTSYGLLLRACIAARDCSFVHVLARSPLSPLPPLPTVCALRARAHIVTHDLQDEEGMWTARARERERERERRSTSTAVIEIFGAHHLCDNLFCALLSDGRKCRCCLAGMPLLSSCLPRARPFLIWGRKLGSRFFLQVDTVMTLL